MNKFRRSLDTGLECFETNLAAALLVVVLVGFTLAILFRYFLLLSIPQMDEIVVIAFTWMAFFSSPNGTKHDAHVSFTVIYDAVGQRAKAFLDVLSKLLMIVVLVILIGPSWETVCFYAMRKTAMLKMPFNWLYMPYMYFLLVTLYYLATNLWGDVRRLRELMRAESPAKQEGGE